jgi:hypothetical protein
MAAVYVCFNLIDESTRECLMIRAERSWSAANQIDISTRMPFSMVCARV